MASSADRRLQAVDERLREAAERVVVRDPAPLLRLNPLGPQPVSQAPLLELGPEPDHVDERLLHGEPARREPPVVGVEVAVDRDAARLREGDRLADLAPLEVPLWKPP